MFRGASGAPGNWSSPSVEGEGPDAGKWATLGAQSGTLPAMGQAGVVQE